MLQHFLKMSFSLNDLICLKLHFKCKHFVLVFQCILICYGVLTNAAYTDNKGDINMNSGHNCGHQPTSKNEAVFDVKVDPNPDHHAIRKRSADHPLRIHLHYDQSIGWLPSSHRRIVQSLVREAVDYWQRTLMVRPAVSAIRLNRQCTTDGVRYKEGARYCVGSCRTVTRCGDIIIPTEHLERCYFWDSFTGLWRSNMNSGPGVTNTDFILYVAALSTSRCQKARTIAYAAHCQQEVVLDRPVAGYFSICPDSITVEKHDQLQLLSTLKHEILHALGFSAGLYAFYYDKNGVPLTPRNPLTRKPYYNSNLNLYQWSDRVVRDVTRYNWKLAQGRVNWTVKVMVTPKVVEEVRRHFNCPTLEGAELENQGIEGTALTHWEKRIFENEAMTGTYTQNPVISRITLAMMEDTGWYNARYENAEELEWGKNLGCDFVNKSCLDWIDTQRARNGDIHPYCDNVRHGVLETECTRNRDAVAFCNLVEFNTSLDSSYQYFKNLKGVSPSRASRYGGSVILADFCPFLQEFEWRSGKVTIRDSRCTLRENNPDEASNYFGEKYGVDSKCFNHGSLWQLQQCNTLLSVSHFGSGCYQYQCSSIHGVILVIGGQSFPCSKAGQRVQVAYTSNSFLHTGSVVCPSCQEICKNSGTTCPPEKQPYTVVNTNHQLRAPCSANSLIGMSVLQITWTSILANLLFFIVVYQCHR